MRVIFALAALLFLSSCSSKFAYDNIDWWVYWYLDDYIELNSEQEAQFDDYLDSWLQWHKTSELVRYKAQLEQMKQQVTNDELNYTQVTTHFEQAKAHWARVRNEVSPELIKMAKNLSDEQVVTLFAALEKENKEEEEELASIKEDSAEVRNEKRIERMEENVSARIGKLSNEQKQIIATYADQFVPTMEEWIAYRRNIQNAARRLFVARRVDPDFENKLLALMNKPETYRSKVFNEASEHNTKTMATMIAEVASTLSTKQKETLIENIDEFIETIENFQQ